MPELRRAEARVTAAPRTVSGKRLVIAILVFVAATLAVYPLVRRHVMEQHARERAAERAREAAQDHAASR